MHSPFQCCFTSPSHVTTHNTNGPDRFILHTAAHSVTDTQEAASRQLQHTHRHPHWVVGGVGGGALALALGALIRGWKAAVASRMHASPRTPAVVKVFSRAMTTVDVCLKRQGRQGRGQDRSLSSALLLSPLRERHCVGWVGLGSQPGGSVWLRQGETGEAGERHDVLKSLLCSETSPTETELRRLEWPSQHHQVACMRQASRIRSAIPPRLGRARPTARPRRAPTACRTDSHRRLPLGASSRVFCRVLLALGFMGVTCAASGTELPCRSLLLRGRGPIRCVEGQRAGQ